jgi:putative Holliday junction resolvase
MAELRLLLGFDYGTKQIGVAVGQVITGQARELCTLKAQNGVPDWAQVEKLVAEWKPDAIVVGLPLNMDGTDSPRTQSVRAFARNLAPLGLPILLWDERWSTQAVTRTLLEADASRARRDVLVDKLAASYILQGAIDGLMAGF